MNRGRAQLRDVRGTHDLRADIGAGVSMSASQALIIAGRLVLWDSKSNAGVSAYARVARHPAQARRQAAWRFTVCHQDGCMMP
jgi:hypothetical protein